MYVIADRDKAAAAGFAADLHRTEGRWMVLNEKEVRFAAGLEGTLAERAAELGGKVYTYAEARDFLAELRREYHVDV